MPAVNIEGGAAAPSVVYAILLTHLRWVVDFDVVATQAPFLKRAISAHFSTI
jgi:hypothetical protein